MTDTGSTAGTERVGRGAAFYSLVLLALSAIASGWVLSVVGIVHVGLVAAGLGYLLFRRPRAEAGAGSGLPWGPYLVVLSFVFILSEFRGVPGPPDWLSVVRAALVAAALVGLVLSRSALRPFGKLDLAIAVCLVAVGVVSIVRNSGMPVAGDAWARWRGPVWLVQAVLAYLVVSRTLRSAGPGVERRLVQVLCVSFAAMAAIGVGRIAGLVYTGSAAVQALGQGQYSEARQLAARTLEANSRLGLGWASADRLTQRMLAASRGAGQSPEVLLVVGEIAECVGAWESASAAYSAVTAADPRRADIRAKWGTSLFEQGLRAEALAVLADSAWTDSSGAESRLALAVSLSRMASWAEAVREFRWVARSVGLLPRLHGYRGRVVTVRLDTLLASPLQADLAKLTLFEMTRLLEEAGCRVFHEGMRIGSTAVMAPVDIVAVSGGGRSSPDESVRVGGTQVSRHLRGYNIVVVDPSSGTVKEEDGFDTWKNQADFQRLAKYLGSLGQGSIVVGVIHEPGTSGLTAAARLAMERVGLGSIPENGWSHAFVGVKGAESGTAVEASGKSARAVAGVLAGNIDGDVARDPERLARFLEAQSGQAPARAAVYLGAAGARTVLTVAALP
jgi:hypothetical protein